MVIRKGDIVYQLMAASRGTNPLADVGSTIITDEPRQPASGGLQTGGVWDLLPTLERSPSGWWSHLRRCQKTMVLCQHPTAPQPSEHESVR